MTSDDKIDVLLDAVTQLADAIRLQSMALHALADAIAAPVEGEQDEEQSDKLERYMNGEPIE